MQRKNSKIAEHKLTLNEKRYQELLNLDEHIGNGEHEVIEDDDVLKVTDSEAYKESIISYRASISDELNPIERSQPDRVKVFVKKNSFLKLGGSVKTIN